eukprot:366391-Chlamydomonas_euryale.AAC.42
MSATSALRLASSPSCAAAGTSGGGRTQASHQSVGALVAAAGIHTNDSSEHKDGGAIRTQHRHARLLPTAVSTPTPTPAPAPRQLHTNAHTSANAHTSTNAVSPAPAGRRGRTLSPAGRCALTKHSGVSYTYIRAHTAPLLPK